MSTESKAMDVLKGWIEQQSTSQSGNPLYQIPVYLPNNNTKKAIPCILIEVEQSEEMIPGTGNMDLLVSVVLQTALEGKDAINNPAHRAKFDELRTQLVKDSEIRTYANDELGPNYPFHLYRSYFTNSGPDPSSKKVLQSGANVRMVCVIPAVS